MSDGIRVCVDASIAAKAAETYRQSLQPADDLFISDLTDHSELETMRSLELWQGAAAGPDEEEDPDATARLPMLDIGALPVEVRANLGATAEDDAQAVA